MRTKTLLLAAAVSSLGVASSMAQVYSANAVGFYNVSLQAGFTMIANQLNNGANNINTVLPSVPDGSTLLSWDAATQMFGAPDLFIDGAGWLDANFAPSTTVLAPGGGAFIALPTGTSRTVTFVGEIPEGTLSKNLVPNFQIGSQLTPREVGLNATGFPAGDGDTILFWDTATQSYTAPLLYIAGGGWFDALFNPVDPTPLLGQSFFYSRVPANGNATWSYAFDVTP